MRDSFPTSPTNTMNLFTSGALRQFSNFHQRATETSFCLHNVVKENHKEAGISPSLVTSAR